MEQMAPLAAYFAAQYVSKPEVLGGVLPKLVLDWLPMVCGALAFLIMQKYSQAQAAKMTSELIGKPAPDFTLEFPEKPTKTLQAFVKETGLPTLVDFYQNF